MKMNLCTSPATRCARYETHSAHTPTHSLHKQCVHTRAAPRTSSRVQARRHNNTFCVLADGRWAPCAVWQASSSSIQLTERACRFPESSFSVPRLEQGNPRGRPEHWFVLQSSRAGPLETTMGHLPSPNSNNIVRTNTAADNQQPRLAEQPKQIQGKPAMISQCLRTGWPSWSCAHAMLVTQYYVGSPIR